MAEQAASKYNGLGFARHQGRRDYQEDSYAFRVLEDADTRSVIIALADGMGGHVGGAVASQIAVATISDPAPSTLSPENLRSIDYLSQQIENANTAIANKLDEDPGLKGMGCTLVVLSITEQGYLFASVGDSPLWIYRNGEFIRLNADHSMVPVLEDLVAAGRMSAEEARHDPGRNALRSALTGAEINLLDVSDKFIPMQRDDILVLASDGLQTLPDAQIVQLIKSHDKDAGNLAQSLTDAVLAAGSDTQDNITVAVIKATEFLQNPGIIDTGPETDPKTGGSEMEEQAKTGQIQGSGRTRGDPSGQGTRRNLAIGIALIVLVALFVYLYSDSHIGKFPGRE